MSTRVKLIVAIFFLVATKTSLNAQRIALTSNLLEDALLTPNFGVELVMADKQTLSLDASIAPYKLSQQLHNKCMTFKVGYKLWFNQSLYAHFMGIDAIASSRDVQVGKLNYRDELVGLGLSYGYSFIIGKRLNLVPSVGAGLAYGRTFDGYDQMVDIGMGEEAVVTQVIRPIITRFGVTLQYVLK